MTDAPSRTRGITAGRIFGARIVIQGSTLIMLVVLAFLFSSGSGVELNRRTFTTGLILAVLLFASVFLHELAHAASARAFGRRVDEVVITLWGGHTTFDARGITPRVSGLTAAAGPAANLLLAGLGYALLQTTWFDATLLDMIEGGFTGRWLIGWLVWANLILAAFNALPGIPMDGGRILEAVVWAVTGDRFRATKAAAWAGRVIAIAVVIVAVGLPLTRGEAPTWFDIVWAGLIFMVLWPAATSALKMAELMGKRERATIGAVMVPAIGVMFDATVEHAREAALRAGAVEVVVVAADGAPAGHFPVSLTEAVPAEARATTGLQSVTMPVPRGLEVGRSLAGDALIERLREWWGRTDAFIVVDEASDGLTGEVVGVARLADVMKALQ